MSEINWDLAPEGTERLVQTNSYITWSKASELWSHHNACWSESTSPWKTIATRTQQKTVADAYEWAKGEWEECSETIWWSKDADEFMWGDNVTDDTICTREQFEAYAKEQEAKQEGEKWTHVDSDGNKCKILHTIGEHSWVAYKNKSYEDELWPNAELKPIKPTLTKAEAWDKLMERKTNSAEVNTLKQQYDII